MAKNLLIFISIFIYGCNSSNINNKDRRNENWIYWIDEKTGEESWVKIGNETTIKDGIYTSFYNKGTIYKKGKLKNAVEIDTISFFDLNEKIIQYLIVKPDTLIHYYLKNGPYTSYSQSGKIFEKGNVENHQIGNKWTKYFENGKIEWTKKLVNGTGWNYWYYQNGQISDQNYHLNGKINGEVKTWHENGKIKEISNWSNSVQNGLFELFYKNGNLEERTNYTNGKSEGASESWYENGLKKNIKVFKNNLLDGNIRQWYSNGKMELNANYSSGQKNGKTIVYFENGNLRAETNYKNDLKNGVFIFYDENGNFTKKENYINGQLVE